MSVALLLVAGVTAGAVNAIAGGGSLITFPALIAAGLPPLAANVTNSIAVSPGYLASTVASRADLDFRLAVRLLPTTVLGSGVGCLVLLTTPTSAFEAVVPVLILTASLALLLPQRTASGAPSTAQHAVTFALSVYGGYFGAGFGVLMISGLSLVLATSLLRISALKNVISLAAGLTSAIIFGLFAPVHWDAVAIVAPATIIGGYLGARLARRTPVTVLRVCVVLFGVAIAGWLAVR